MRWRAWRRARRAAVESRRGSMRGAARCHGGREIEAPVVAKPDAVIEQISSQPTLFIGDGAHAYRESIQQRMSGGGVVAENPTPLLAGTIAIIASEVAAQGVSSPAH